MILCVYEKIVIAQIILGAIGMIGYLYFNIKWMEHLWDAMAIILIIEFAVFLIVLLVLF